MKTPMIFIKHTATVHVKLECCCGRQFWFTPQVVKKSAACPDCKRVWNGIYITSFNEGTKTQ